MLKSSVTSLHICLYHGEKCAKTYVPKEMSTQQKVTVSLLIKETSFRLVAVINRFTCNVFRNTFVTF